MKALKIHVTSHRLVVITLVLLTGLAILLFWTARSWAQSPIPHAVGTEREDCLSCHQSGVFGAPRVAWDHLGRDNDDCLICHQASGAPASEITHPVTGWEACLSCHLEGIGSTPGLTGNHIFYANEECVQCHFPSPAALQPPPIPTPPPTPKPVASPAPSGENTCVGCHQLIFADEEHMLFTGQPLGDSEVGATLFAQLCVRCHGESGTTLVGDEGKVINSEAYWSTHDDAAILIGIGAGAEGEMPAFAEAYGGPLSWEQILDLAAFVRSWGPVAPPSEVVIMGGDTFVEVIGPLLTERCGACHGGMAGLTVTDYASLMVGSDSGPVIVPGDPDSSSLVEVMRGEHYSQLSEAELSLLVEWIAAGAPEQ